MTKPESMKKKSDGQVAVVDDLVHMAGGVGFKDVEPYDDNGGYAAQPVKNVVVVFFTAWGNGRMLRFQHERSCCSILFCFNVKNRLLFPPFQ